MKAMRANVIVNVGKPKNQLGAVLIETPPIYKRLDNIGIIQAIGPKCKHITKDMIGKKCIVSVQHHEEDRIKQEDGSWLFNIHESTIEALLF